MAGERGVVPHFDGRDGGLAGFYAVEEVAAVLGGLVELDFAEIFGEWHGDCRGGPWLLVYGIGVGFDPVGVGGVEAAAIDPDPSVGADPLGAHADGRRATPDGEGDVIRVAGDFFAIGAFDGVLESGIPDGVGGWKF